MAELAEDDMDGPLRLGEVRADAICASRRFCHASRAAAAHSST
jgi:hypothetical protein